MQARFREELLIHDIDLDAVARRASSSRTAERSTRGTNRGGATAHRCVPASLRLGRAPVSPRIAGPLGEVSEVWDALVLATRDYVAKTGFEIAGVALSGGIDSALVAAVAAEALGPERVVGVSLPSRFSSEGSRADARQLADNLGMKLMMIPIEGAFQASLDMLADAFTDTQFGIAEENLQARIRGNVMMSLSNKFGWLVLTTGNKSELATGYCTLYGDMAGGYAVIKDVPKTLSMPSANMPMPPRGATSFPVRSSTSLRAPSFDRTSSTATHSLRTRYSTRSWRHTSKRTARWMRSSGWALMPISSGESPRSSTAMSTSGGRHRSA